jgi:hypothetical protein
MIIYVEMDYHKNYDVKNRKACEGRRRQRKGILMRGLK